MDEKQTAAIKGLTYMWEHVVRITHVEYVGAPKEAAPVLQIFADQFFGAYMVLIDHEEVMALRLHLLAHKAYTDCFHQM